MKAEEKRCTVNGELVGLGTKPVYGPFLGADIDKVITDEREDIVTGACCVCGDVAELLYRFSDGLDVRHSLRVGHVVRSERRADVVDGTRAWEVWFGNSSGFAEPRCHPSKVWLGQEHLVFISHDMNTQLGQINDLLEKDSELRDVCGLLHSGVLSHQSTENKG